MSKQSFVVCAFTWVSILFLFSWTVDKATAQQSEYLLDNPDFVADMQAAIDYAYDFRFDQARASLSDWEQKYPDHPVWVFWDGLPVWWKILNDLESEQHDSEFLEIMRRADHASNRMLRGNRRHLDALVVKSLTNGLMARLHSNRHNWYHSFNHARTALNILFNIEQIYPETTDLQFGLGLYRYFAAFLADEYRLVRTFSWMLPEGDRPGGLERLKEAAENSAFFIPESTYFLGHIYLHFEKEYEKAEPFLNTLTENYPNNSYFQRLMLRTHFARRNIIKATELADSLLANDSFKSNKAFMEEVHTIRGRLYMRVRNFDRAEEHFKSALSLGEHFPNADKRRYQTQARYFLARVYKDTHRTEQARAELQHIIRSRPDSPYLSNSRELLRQL